MDTSVTILLATGNAHKVKELQGLLSGTGVTLLGLGDVPGLKNLEVAETGPTFAENARIKALGYGAHSSHFTLAEDSGICVAALDGAPGVKSARYGGDTALDDRGRLDLLLENMAGKTDRRAWYACAMCLVKDGRVLVEVQGEVHGTLATQPHGEGGFGYDPIFVPDGYEQTFGELPGGVKAAISHRAKATGALAAKLRRLAA